MTPLPPLLEEDDPLGLAKSLADRSLSIARHAITLQPALTVTPDGRVAQVLRHSPIGAQRRFPSLSASAHPETDTLDIPQRLALAKSRANSITSRLGAYRDMQLPTDSATVCQGSAIPGGFVAIRGLDVGWTGNAWSVMGATIDCARLGIGSDPITIPNSLLSPVDGIIFARYSLQFADRDQDTADADINALTLLSAGIEIAPTLTVQHMSPFAMLERADEETGDFSQKWTPGDYISPIAYVVAGTKRTPPVVYRFPNAGAVPTRHEFSTPTQAETPQP